jgi:hypothetical protein
LQWSSGFVEIAMTTVLFAVTVLSVVTALALLAYVAQLRRNERDRSEARVAALAAAMGTHTAVPEATRLTLAADAGALDGFAREPSAPDHGPPSHDGRLAGASIAAGQLFAPPMNELPDALPRKWLMLTAATVIGAFALGSTLMTGGPANLSPTTSAATHGSDPLELVSLRHRHEAGTLTVAGLVRNPPSASQKDHIQAVVFAFDAGGALVTSARASLADSSLRGGGQAPFSITIPQAAAIRRYRVSFHSEGRLVPHVDRRRERLPSHSSIPTS